MCAQPSPAVGFQELPSVLEDHSESPQLATLAGEPLAFGGRGHFLLEKSFEFSVLKLLWFSLLKQSLKITNEWQVLGIHARKTKSVTEGVNKSRRKYCPMPAVSVLGRRKQDDSGCSAMWADPY